MAKKKLQDVIPNRDSTEVRRAISNSPLKRERVVRTAAKEIDDEPVRIKKIVKAPAPKQRLSKTNDVGKKFLIAVSVLGVGALAVFVASLIWSSATIEITPKRLMIAVDTTYTAKKDAVQPELKYEVITSTKSTSATVSATPGPITQSKAKGSVVIYNTQPTAQRLTVSTRLESTKGLIYKIDKEVTVPPAVTSRGKTTIGSAVVAVTSDQSGDIYNLSIESLDGDFKIPGFVGTPRYTKVYGRIKTPIAGGFIGRKMTVDPAIASTTTISLQSSLTNSLVLDFKKLVPEGYVTFDDAYIITYDASSTAMIDDAHANITQKGTISGIIFKESLLGQYITSREVDRFGTSTYLVKGLRDLKFRIENPKEFSLAKGTALLFKLKGVISMEGIVASDEVKKAISGKTLADSQAVFSKYPIDGVVNISFIPFWKKVFPISLDRITIELK